VQVEAPDKCEKCGGEVEQDPDTLDTWFSSALWPFAALGWPDEEELGAACNEGVYPTAVMITARDILYLWIVRMIMTSLEFTGTIPFRQVLVHPTVLDIEGRRMSKSLGTGLDPLELISKYGADATRFSLLYQCASDQDIRFGEERTEMARNFCNKIWNASRFVLMNIGGDFAPAQDVPRLIGEDGSLAERWILSRHARVLEAVNTALDSFEMAEATRALYSFFWSEFCDWFVEICKPALRSGRREGERARQVLWFVLERSLRALHPFLPFTTEEIWQQIPGTRGALIEASWPAWQAEWRDEQAEQEMEALMGVVVAARKLRADQKVAPGQRVSISVASGSEALRRVVSENEEAILLLARGRDLSLSENAGARPAMAELVQWRGQTAAVSIARKVSKQELQQQRARLERELSRLAEEEKRLQEKLHNPQFQARAPAQVQEKTRARRAGLQERREALEAQLAEVAGSSSE